ncbi:ankyrin repeat protein [Seminavis robusta]|uniref:Ankyrin repeat protein n=1 Tax=Seminavis robusta TaxID=568900 RepID=A0A9N8DQY1_9STRA|nr:ankyrin repeat protein [Seminavis robusta]|eukprot:Sro218_g090100.1 ankyrin repeat protein (641) ;mRNA; r:42823-44889
MMRQEDSAPIGILLGQQHMWVDNIFPFLGKGHYALVGAVNKQFNQHYKEFCKKAGSDPCTFYRMAFRTVSCAEYWYSDSSRHKTLGKDWVCAEIARHGRLRVLEWAHNKGYEWNGDTAEAAAESGQLEVLQWLHEQGCTVNEWTCTAAAGGGHLRVLKWAREQNCSWNIYAAADAARYGHFETLKWAIENGCYWDTNTCSGAAEAGHFGILKWAREKGCPWDKRTCTSAANSGHLEIVKWAQQNGCHWDADTCSAAAGGGHLSILKWAHENGCPWDASVCASAAAGGHLGTLKWLHEHRCPWNEGTCSAAAGGGHLAVLTWAHENGCPWNSMTCTLAARNGRLGIIQWARDKGCPWDARTCLEAAYGRLEVLKWAHQNGCPWDARTCQAAAGGGFLEVLRWASMNGCPWDGLTCSAAAAGGHLDVLKWARGMHVLIKDGETATQADTGGYQDKLLQFHLLRGFQQQVPLRIETPAMLELTGDLVVCASVWETRTVPVRPRFGERYSMHMEPPMSNSKVSGGVVKISIVTVAGRAAATAEGNQRAVLGSIRQTDNGFGGALSKDSIFPGFHVSALDKSKDAASMPLGDGNAMAVKEGVAVVYCRGHVCIGCSVTYLVNVIITIVTKPIPGYATFQTNGRSQ